MLFRAKDGRRKPGKSRNGKAIATIRWSFRQFMQQHEIALPFPRTDMVKRERIKFFGEPRQLMIVRSKAATSSIDLMHSLHHGPGKRKPVIGERAAPDFKIGRAQV